MASFSLLPPGGSPPGSAPSPTGQRIERVAAVVDDGVSPFEFAVACEVFGIDRSAEGLPGLDFSVCSPRAGAVRAQTGFDIVAPHRLGPLDRADLIVVPACSIDYVPPPALVRKLRAAVERGTRVASLCSGAFILARAGILDGRRATTHWRYSRLLAEMFPRVDVVPDVLFVEDGPVYSSAGTAAGIDLSLHLMRQSHGPAVATGIARRMVVPPQREGGQAQYIESPVRAVDANSLAPVLDWATAHLDEDLSVKVLAARAAMSERTFARRFRDETGTTPHHWLLRQRVAVAEQLLETTQLSIEEVARRCGYGSATMLRHHFTAVRGTSPSAYRRRFGCGAAG
jgi:transcriptional regulator GlxA family with amidase domain